MTELLDAVPPETAIVVGTGLIGTSIALALTASGTRVWLSDTDQRAAQLAADLGAGEQLPRPARPGDRPISRCWPCRRT